MQTLQIRFSPSRTGRRLPDFRDVRRPSSPIQLRVCSHRTRIAAPFRAQEVMWLAAQTQRFTFACAQAFGLLDTRTAPCPPADETNTAPRRVIGLGCWLVCGCWPACWGLGNCTRTPCPRSVRPFLAWMTCASTRAACRHACFVADACTFGAQQHLPRLLRSHRLHAFRIRCLQVTRPGAAPSPTLVFRSVGSICQVLRHHVGPAHTQF